MNSYKNKKNYMIVLFCNKKIINVFHNTVKKRNVTDKWHELKTEKKPRFIRLDTNRGKTRLYELALIYPADKRATPIYTKDELGRNVEVILESKKHRIKDIVPYWKEEKIFSYDMKKQIRYHEFIELFTSVSDIAQIFKLNNKLVLQIEDNFKMFGTKNKYDCDRLFNLLREDLLEKKYGNFIYVKDVTTVQRMRLYKLLVNYGYNKKILYRHYSY